jgi:hypothetical protein
MLGPRLVATKREIKLCYKERNAATTEHLRTNGKLDCNEVIEGAEPVPRKFDHATTWKKPRKPNEVDKISTIAEARKYPD